MGGTFRRLTGNRRDTASFGAATLGVLLLAGAVLGTGVARTAVDVSDGLTWLPDSPRGEVVQVNPSTGRPETRLQVSGGDAQLEITQKDDLLVVLDRRTGQVTVLDLATLLASGRRQTPPGAATKVLVSDGRIYVVDRVAGTVTNADPVTLVDLGTPWRAGQPLADVVADDAGVVWAADNGGNLHELHWSDDDARFDEKSDEPVRGAGPGTVLVPHARGVTLFGLDGGVVLQVGTDRDVSATTPSLDGEVLAALSSPAGLVPAAVPGEQLVVIVAGDRLLRVDVGALGCVDPGRPVVFRDRVYVPCRGAAKVILLDRTGGRGGPDVRTSGDGDPELVSDDGRLFISAPGAERGVIVDADGSTRPVVIRSPDLPVVDPDRPPTQDVPTPPRPSPRPDEPDEEDGGTQARPPEAPGPGVGQPSQGAQGRPPGAPPGVTVMLGARSAGELNLTVSWSAPADNGDRISGYTVVATGSFDGGSRTATTAGTSTGLTIPCAGSTFCDGGRLDVTVTAANRNGTSAAGTGSWTVPPQGGSPTTGPTQTTTTVAPPPPTTTTTEPPPPPPTTTTTEPPPPPPATVPSAGATVITGSTAPNGQIDNLRRLTLSPPGDWASHDGPCEVVNTTQGYSTGIPCSAGSVDVYVETGSNRFVVRAHARDGSRSVESAARGVRGPKEPMCGQYVCVAGDKIVDLSPTAQPVRFGQAGAGVGLLVIALLLRFYRREDKDGMS